MKSIILIFVFSLIILPLSCLQAQDPDFCDSAEPGAGVLAWVEFKDDTNPVASDSIFLYVDVSQDPNCDILVNYEDDLYIWTWGPIQPDDKIGTWNNSNDEAKFKHVDGTIYRMEFIPTEFYGVEEALFYEHGICFLAKGKDGGSGGDCSAGGGDFKTTDIHVPIPKPPGAVQKVYAFPAAIAGTGVDTLLIRTDDVLTIFYNNAIEDKETILNLDEVWVYFRVLGDDGDTYAVSNLFVIGDNSDLQMQNNGGGLFSLSFIPDEFLAETLPDGVRPQTLWLQFLRWPFINSNDQVDGSFKYEFKCLDE